MGNYTTVQGDMWDFISLKAYNTEKLMYVLIDANPQYRNMVVFPANCELVVPEVSKVGNPAILPWKRNA